MTTHYLKSRDMWFDRVVDGTKTAELRKHDRDFQVGDTLVLVRVTDRTGMGWKAEELARRDHKPAPTVSVAVTHVLPHHLAPSLLPEGVVLLSFAAVDKAADR